MALQVSTASRSMAALFGDDGDAAPLWFRKDAFTSPDGFDAEAYLADLRKIVDLESIRSELRRHLAGLKNELVELINRDYADFVNLTTKLVDVDGAVLRMRTPLNDLRAKLLLVKDSLQCSLKALQDGLKRRSEASEAREILELLLDTAHVVSKIEKLLAELKGMLEDGGVDSSTDSVAAQSPGYSGIGEATEHVSSLEESRSRLLERIASEMNRVKFNVVRGQDLQYIQNMDKRIHNASVTLNATLSRCFEVGLERRDEAVIFRCIRAYAAVDNVSGAQEVFRITVVAPLVHRVFLPKEVGGASGDLIEEELEEMKKLIETRCKFFLDIAASASTGIHAFDFLGNSILKEVHSGIEKVRPGAFSPGKPTEFLANYKASVRFLNFLEGYCTSKSAVLTFRSQPSYVDFMKQWNLGVYFTLRFQETASLLDSCLTTAALSLIQETKLPEEGGASLGLALKSSVVLHQCLLRCWQDDVYVASLSDKFLSLALELLSRFSSWLSAGLAARKAGISSSGVEWALAAVPEDLLLVRHDIEILVRNLTNGYVEDVAKIFQAAPPNVVDMVKQSILGGANALLQAIPAVTDVLVEALAKKCMEVLMQLKGITATYRMTNKPYPTRHSPYVSSILQPLQAFLEGDCTSYLSEEMQMELVMIIVSKVTARFSELAGELLTLAKKTEYSLQRLRQEVQRKKGQDSSEKAVSDTDKICIQLFLDVQEYGRRLNNFGVDPLNLTAYISLWQCVAPSDKQSNIEF